MVWDGTSLFPPALAPSASVRSSVALDLGCGSLTAESQAARLADMVQRGKQPTFLAKNFFHSRSSFANLSVNDNYVSVFASWFHRGHADVPRTSVRVRAPLLHIVGISPSKAFLARGTTLRSAGSETSVAMEGGRIDGEQLLFEIFRNISRALKELKLKSVEDSVQSKSEDQAETSAGGGEDGAHAYLYILFVLTFYAFSIVVLMVKYIRKRSTRGTKVKHPRCSKERHSVN